MTTPQPPRWYCVNNMGMATLCADQADAENVASDCDTEWPRQSPHRAVQLVEASALDTERAACAAVCADMAQQLRSHGDVAGAEIAEALRDAIRARGAA